MAKKTTSNNDPIRESSPDEPGETVLSSPELAPTMMGGDTVRDPAAPENGEEAEDTQVLATPDTEISSDHSNVETFISDRDIAEAPDADGTDSATQATFISTADQTPDTVITQEPPAANAAADPGATRAMARQSPAVAKGEREGLIIGDYEVLSELGRGGMGVVYKARHRTLNRIVALKMILAGPHASNEALERFTAEARAVAHLQHPGIVQIFDIGQHDGMPYFSLEFVEGSDLKVKLDRQPQDASFAANIVEKLARAMQYAHDNKILHRDIKPPNVLLDVDGNPKITDFGLAKQVDGEAASTGTTAGTIMGSPSYMPPEQARGEISSVSPRSDLYSLGAVLYEMLTGRPPFLAKKPIETVMQVVSNEPVSPRDLQPEIPVDIETICLKAMQKEQAARYADCGALADDLKRFLDGKPIQARPVGKLERLMKWCKRNPKIAVPSGLAIGAIALTAIIASWAWQATSALAGDLKIERDNVTEQRDNAEKQKAIAETERNEANRQKAIAEDNEKKAVAAQDEAEKQRGLALVAQKKAEDNEKKAVAAQQKAEESEEIAKKQSLVALGSIQFVLTKVDRELQTRPQLSDARLALMNALSKKWDEINVELSGGKQGEAAPTLMAVRKQIADIYTELDEIEKADGEYEKLYLAGKERVQIKEGSDASRYNLAQICLGWAPVRKRSENDPGAALRLHEEAIAIMKDISENPRPQPNSPGPIQIQAVTAQIIQNTGVEYLHSGLIDKTAEKWEEALKLNRRLLTAVPDAKEFDEKEARRDVFLKYFAGEVDRGSIGLGYLQLRRGETEDALKLYDKGIEGSRAKHLADPTDVRAMASLGGYLDMLGEAYLWLNRPADAEGPLGEAQKYLKDAYASDPAVARTARSFGFNLYHLAVLADLQSKTEERKAAATASRDVYAGLVEKSPDRKNKIMLMLVEARLGNAKSARPLIDEFGKTDKPDTEAHLDRAKALSQLSRAAETEDARQKLIGEALTAIERCVKDGYSDPFRLTHDYDLQPIQAQPRMKQLLEQLKKTNEE